MNREAGIYSGDLWEFTNKTAIGKKTPSTWTNNTYNELRNLEAETLRRS